LLLDILLTDNILAEHLVESVGRLQVMPPCVNRFLVQLAGIR
jgi:hypothetical protein